MTADKELEGTVATHAWPAKLASHVASAGRPVRVHGYDLHGDLAVHYDFGEYIVLALTGAPPPRQFGAAANIALVALADATVANASVHCATLARRCGADAKGALATGLVALAEEAEHVVASSEEPSQHESAAGELFAALPEEVRRALGAPSSTVRATAIAILRLVGLNDPLQLQAAVSLARMPVMVAETLAVERGDIRDYPMQLPRFDYQPPGVDE